ncbi:hypothetical protein MRX96_054920 [Rhipicephalus microplus]
MFYNDHLRERRSVGPHWPPRNGTKISSPTVWLARPFKTCGSAGFLFRPVAVVVGCATPPSLPPVRQPLREKESARSARPPKIRLSEPRCSDSWNSGVRLQLYGVGGGAAVAWKGHACAATGGGL